MQHSAGEFLYMSLLITDKIICQIACFLCVLFFTRWFTCETLSFPWTGTFLQLHPICITVGVARLKDILRYRITLAEDYYWFAHGAVSLRSASGSRLTDSDGVGWPSQPTRRNHSAGWSRGRRREIEEWIAQRDKGNWWLFQRWSGTRVEEGGRKTERGRWIGNGREMVDHRERWAEIGARCFSHLHVKELTKTLMFFTKRHTWVTETWTFSHKYKPINSWTFHSDF